jgi:hypothetical protein
VAPELDSRSTCKEDIIPKDSYHKQQLPPLSLNLRCTESMDSDNNSTFFSTSLAPTTRPARCKT